MKYAASWIKKQIKPKIKQWISPHPEVAAWKTGTRFTLLIIAAQSASFLLFFLIINTIVLVQDHTTTVGHPTVVVTTETPLLLKFQDNTSIQQVQSLFEKHQLNFINGPNAAGLYTVKNQSKQSQTLLRTKLQSEDQIISFIKTAN
jgi:hypothetical protein